MRQTHLQRSYPRQNIRVVRVQSCFEERFSRDFTSTSAAQVQSSNSLRKSDVEPRTRGIPQLIATSMWLAGLANGGLKVPRIQ